MTLLVLEKDVAIHESEPQKMTPFLPEWEIAIHESEPQKITPLLLPVKTEPWPMHHWTTP